MQPNEATASMCAFSFDVLFLVFDMVVFALNGLVYHFSLPFFKLYITYLFFPRPFKFTFNRFTQCFNVLLVHWVSTCFTFLCCCCFLTFDHVLFHQVSKDNLPPMFQHCDITLGFCVFYSYLPQFMQLSFFSFF